MRKPKPIPQLDARQVNPILKRYGFKLPDNVQRRRSGPGVEWARKWLADHGEPEF